MNRLSNRGTGVLLGVGVALVFLIALGGGIVWSFASEDNVTFTVKKLERITESDADGKTTSKYLVYTDKEVFKNTDAPLHGKFNSSDLYAKLDEGKTYVCKVNGIRVAFFSSYRNLLECRVR